MAGTSEAEEWEDLEKLTINDPPTTSPVPAAPVNAEVEANNQSQQAGGSSGRETAAATIDAIDPAIRQALNDSKERVTVLRIEDLVVEYISKSSPDVLEFPPSYSNYQRLLAHRVAQHYGLQTHTVDYEEGNGRVVARRTPDTQLLQVKLSDLAPRTPPERATLPAKILKRPVLDDGGRAQPGGSDTSSAQSPARTAKEREEDYNQARERIIGKPIPAEAADRSNRSGRGPTPVRGGDTGSGAGAGGSGAGGSGAGAIVGGANGSGRVRKAVFRDRDRELQDPDYRRGVGNRFAPERFDPNYAGVPAAGIYNTPSYSTEFPSLPGKSAGPHNANPKSYRPEYGNWQPGPGYRHPPPPPPPNPPLGAKPYMPAVPPPVAMPRGPYGGMPGMAPFPVHGMGVFPPGVAPGVPGPGPQPGMYGPPPPYAYAGMPMPPAGYGYLPPPPPGQEMVMAPAGPFPMYPAYPPGPGPMPYPHMMPQIPSPPTRIVHQGMPYHSSEATAGPPSEKGYYGASGSGHSHHSGAEGSRRGEQSAYGDDTSSK